MAMTLDRRSLLAGTAAAAAATLAPVVPVRAASEPAAPIRPQLYRFKLGAFEVTTILDGTIVADGPHPIFGENQDPAAVAALAEANFLPPGKIENGFTVTLVDTGSELILFDAGNGAARRPNAGRLLTLLGQAGVAPGDIDRVVLTHFHGDHIGGLIEDGQPAFPNALYTAGQAEYDFWTRDEHLASEAMKPRAELVRRNVVPFAEKTTFIAPGASVAPGIEAIGAFGHTPGHMAYNIESEGRRLVLIGDACNHYVISVQRPDWHVRFDMDKEAAVATRKSLLGMIAADKVPFVGYHMPFPAIGFLETQGEGFRYTAASYQLNV